ncbi:MAG: hypothetical protein C0599_17430 [Salinivirgaceae bacterium]|nr:MAG: hypothetical protein C0599_17430 [Salinivirgaceae bacterium]
MQILKHIILKLITTAILVTSFLSGCQDEYAEIEEIDSSITITANDNVVGLISKVVLKDGSYDNFIDRCSEISINYPYSIIIEELQLNITSQEDINDIMLEYYEYRDDIEINYPITASYSDYSEIVIQNEDELEEIQENNNVELIDDDIECIDFIYPIEISLYNTNYQTTETAIVYNDYEMYVLFSNVSNLIIEFTLPINLKTYNNETITVANINELEDEINGVIDSCDEADDVDFDENGYPIFELITMHNWSISYYSDSTIETSAFSTYSLKFNPDYTIEIEDNSNIYYGEWEIQSDSLSALDIEIDTDTTPLIWLNEEWDIINTGLNTIEMETESDFEGITKKLNLQKIE